MVKPSPEIILEVARAAGRKLTTAGSSGEFLIECPWSERHRRGDRNPSCRLNPLKGAFYCDPCGRGGGFLELAVTLGVDLRSLRGLGPTSSSKSTKRLPLAFTPANPISETTREYFADQLGKNFEPDTWIALGVLEGDVSPAGGLQKAEPAVAFPLPGGGFHVYRFQRGDKKQRWCFSDGGKASLVTAGLDRSDPTILAEGEWDAMRAYELGYAVAAATGAGVFRAEWANRLGGRRVAIVYDVDPAGRQGAVKAQRALRAAGCQAWDVPLPLSGRIDGDGKDLSDFVAVHGAEAFHDLIRNSESSPSEGPTETPAGLAGLETGKTDVAAAIDAVLAIDAPVRIRRREAARLVIEDLRRRGDLIQAPGYRQFWFHKADSRLHDLDASTFRFLLLADYQLNPAEPEFRPITEALRSEILANGKQVEVYRFAFYNRDRHRLYLSAGNSKVLRLDGDAAVWIDHGTDGVLFEGDREFRNIPDDAPTTSTTADHVYDLILSRVNFSRGSAVILSPEQQRLLLRIWILVVFFAELLPAKVLLLLYGEKGSGKTTALRIILRLLLGPHANVTPLTKEDAFNATVSHEYLVGIDNVDSYCRWIEDRLATVATGQTIRLRKLYTTNEIVSYPTRCFIALTARTPRFRRDDVVDRLQILRVARLDKFSREADWYQEIETQRTVLWAQLIRDLNRVIARLREGGTDAPESIRMADWSGLATAIGDALGHGAAAREVLEATELDKAHFLLEADDLYDLIEGIASGQPDKEWKAGELFAELVRRAEAADIELRIKSPRSLGRILHRLEPALRMIMRFEIRPDAHEGQSLYTLGPRQDPTPDWGTQEP